MSKYEILLQVCESGSISKAAQELNYTQSAVNQAVRSFEKEIGAPLFRRSLCCLRPPLPGTLLPHPGSGLGRGHFPRRRHGQIPGICKDRTTGSVL